MPDHLDVAADCELVHREQDLRAGGLHLRPPDADEGEGRAVRQQRTDEMRAELVSGCFARDDADDLRTGRRPAHCPGTVQRMMPRPSAATKAARRASSGTDSA